MKAHHILTTLILAAIIAGAVSVSAKLAKPDRGYTLVKGDYPRTGVVWVLDHDDDIVVVRDPIGQCWTFFGINDWQIGDMVAMIMNDNGTPYCLYDDLIVQTRCCGTIGTMLDEAWEN